MKRVEDVYADFLTVVGGEKAQFYAPLLVIYKRKVKIKVCFILLLPIAFKNNTRTRCRSSETVRFRMCIANWRLLLIRSSFSHCSCRSPLFVPNHHTFYRRR